MSEVVDPHRRGVSIGERARHSSDNSFDNRRGECQPFRRPDRPTGHR